MKRPAPITMLLLIVVVNIALLGLLAHPAVHYFADQVAARDGGTVLASLELDPKGLVDLLYASLSGLYGPVSFLTKNLYYLAVGNLLPLMPAVTAVPNTLFFIIAAVLVYHLGSRVHSRRLGFFAACVILLEPWAAYSARGTEPIQGLTLLFQAAMIHSYTLHMLNPESRRHAILSPFFLALYLGSGLDYPTFGLFLLVYFVLAKKFTNIINNVYNILPALVIAGHIGWAYFVYSQGGAYEANVLFRPFVRFAASAGEGGVLDLASYGFWTFGLSFLTVIAGLTALARGALGDGGGEPERHAETTHLVRRAFLLAMTAWLVVTMIPLLATRYSPVYGYVAGIPVAVISAVFLCRVPAMVVAALFCAMAAWQWHAVVATEAGLSAFVWDNDDRRVLAAATYLIEERPDLLAADRTAFVPRDNPANANQYARGQNKRIIMPSYFPATRRSRSVGSTQEVLSRFVGDFERDGAIGADWLIMEPALLKTEGRSFYLEVLRHQRIYWIVRFQDGAGREMWLGEVKARGRPLEQAPVADVAPLADAYLKKYNRTDFLRRNVRHAVRY